MAVDEGGRGPTPAEVFVTGSRYYAGRIRDGVLGSFRHRTEAPVLRGSTAGGRSVVLRPPDVSDAAAWRAIRLRDRERIEPFWLTKDCSWEQSHSDRVWIRDVLTARREARTGTAVHAVIEVDGRFAGQCDLWMDGYHQRGELGIWLDSSWAGQGVGVVALGLMIEHGFTTCGLVRIVAPIDTANTAAAHLASRLGLVCEGTMTDYLDVGGHRRDHDLWAVTAKTWRPRLGNPTT